MDLLRDPKTLTSYMDELKDTEELLELYIIFFMFVWILKKSV